MEVGRSLDLDNSYLYRLKERSSQTSLTKVGFVIIYKSICLKDQFWYFIVFRRDSFGQICDSDKRMRLS